MTFKDSKHGPVVSALAYEKPPNMSTSQSIKNFIYDGHTGAVLGRTASSWGKIGLFYLIFYGVLAALVAICFWGFFQTIDPRRPTWQLERSIIGTHPGLGFRPMPPPANVESTLIWYNTRVDKNYEHWVNSLKNFLEVYRRPGVTPGRGENTKPCDYNNPPAPGQVCNVDVRQWDPCTYEKKFGYDVSQPCVFLKLNKIFGWKPEYYLEESELPKSMPKDLRDYIKLRNSTSPSELKTIWVSCEGENPADKENIGPLKYIPRMGFPGYYYPYENSEGYLSPLMAVQFERPQHGILINVKCKAWVQNMKHSQSVGSVHFELLID